MQFLAQLAEILDDAVVDDRDAAVACGWALSSVGLPCVAQRVWPMPIDAGERLRRARLEIAQLALARAPRQAAVFERRDARGIIAAVFEPLQRVDDLARDRLLPENADDAAHYIRIS